jgi:hypothetical protein
MGGGDRFGILIYTAKAGPQGTQGGLVGTVLGFMQILHNDRSGDRQVLHSQSVEE